MDRTERLYRIEKLLRVEGVVRVETFLRDLGISLATFKRDLEYLRDRMNAPIVWDREAGGYRFDHQGVGEKYELPGLWFNASEIHALLTMRQLIANLSPGLLTTHIEPLVSRLKMLLGDDESATSTLESRIRIQQAYARAYEPSYFPQLVTAVLRGKKVRVAHYNRSRNETVERIVSPQRLNYYQENWYLDGWCHLRDGVRRFALDSLHAVTTLDEEAVRLTEEEIRAALDEGYGIFSGGNVEWAELAFTPERARWVSRETWHKKQEAWFEEDGSYRLRVPYSDTRELAMTVMRHIPEVRVISPDSLRELISRRLQVGLNTI